MHHAATTTDHLSPPADRPFVLYRVPRNPKARRWAERAWACYPPAAVLVAAVFLLGGCAKLGLTAGRPDAPAAPTTAGPTTAAADDAPAAAGYPAYPDDLPLVGTAAARATVMHGKNALDLANLSKLPWRDARVWLNRRYSLPLAYLAPGKIERLKFEDFRDDKGATFPTDNRLVVVEELELVLGDERTRVRFGLGY